MVVLVIHLSTITNPSPVLYAARLESIMTLGRAGWIIPTNSAINNNTY